MSHRTRERPAECLASLSLNYDRSAARSTRELVHSLQMYCKLLYPILKPPSDSKRRCRKCIVLSGQGAPAESAFAAADAQECVIGAHLCYGHTLRC
ncbi:hypothetical protein EVAR_56586_1 [Eumeta japonica]|uniref:Uncharacterized protein n=1 Tax=Eumeta variegata TaxID=151549 RepID=A0A4C1YXX4_EUMVA|nr:hypothetical protein EVAR_56586_1 [Eumeta japonica]